MARSKVGMASSEMGVVSKVHPRNAHLPLPNPRSATRNGTVDWTTGVSRGVLEYSSTGVSGWNTGVSVANFRVCPLQAS